MLSNREISASMTVKLDDRLPPLPDFVEGIRRAPDRGFRLSRQQATIALKNALRYLPESLHAQLAPEFLDELVTRGRIYGYRFRPPGPIYGKPVDNYRGNCLDGRAFQVMIDNNLDFDVALYPYELVTYGETGRFARTGCSTGSSRCTWKRSPASRPWWWPRATRWGFSDPSPKQSAGDHHQRPDGRHVRQPGRLGTGGPAGRGQLRPDDGRRMDVHRPPGDRPRHLQHPAQRRPPEARHGGRRGPRRPPVRLLGPGRHERRPAQGGRNRRGGVGSSPKSTASRIETRHDQGWVARWYPAILPEAFRRPAERQPTEGRCPSPITAISSICSNMRFDHEVPIDLLSDQTSCHAAYDGGYCPQGLTFEERTRLLRRRPAAVPRSGWTLACAGTSS